MKENFNFRMFRFLERSLQVAILASDLVMTVHCALMLVGHRFWAAELIAGHSVFGFLALWMASYLLHMCWRFRLCLAHNFFVYCCIIWHREYGFGDMLEPMLWLTTLSGVVSVGLMICSKGKRIVIEQLVGSVVERLKHTKAVELGTIHTDGMENERVEKLKEELLDTLMSDDVTQDEEGLHIVNYE